MALMTITKAGLIAAANAQSGGPDVQITSFAVGSAYNYTPSINDTALHGTKLYPIGSQTAVPSGYLVSPDKTCTYSLIMDDSIGDFSFGEVGLYMPDGTLFALASLSSLQSKVASTTSSAGNTIEMPARLQLAGIAPTISFTTITGTVATLNELSLLDATAPPSAAPANLQRAVTQDEYGRSKQILEADTNNWTSPQYDWKWISGGAIQSASVYTAISTDVGTNLLPKTGRYILRFTSGALLGRVRELILTPSFVASAVYAVNQIRVPTSANGHQYIVTVAGTAGAEPAWPTGSGAAIASGGVTFQEFGSTGTQGVSWVTSTGTAASSGDTFDIFRASSFTDINRYITEYRMQAQGHWYFHAHD